jgi:hypothetical protein
MAWAKNGTPDTLSSTNDTVEITNLTSKKFNQFLIHNIDSGNIHLDLRFNADSNTVYAERSSDLGGADATNASVDGVNYYSSASQEHFLVAYVVSISGEEKLGISFMVLSNSAGAGSNPPRVECVFKYVPSPDADITQVSSNNVGTGDFASDSNLSAIGSD